MALPFKNSTVFAGYVGNDPEIRYIANGDAVLSLRIVSRYSYRDGDQAWKTIDEWATVVLYRKLAESFAEAGHGKGAFIHVEGRRHTRKWTDGQGHRKTAHEIIAADWHAVQLPPSAKDEADKPPKSNTKGREARESREFKPAKSDDAGARTESMA